MSKDNSNKPNPTSADSESVFDKHQHKNPELRARQLRLIKLASIGVGAILISAVIAWISPIGARIATQIALQLKGDLALPTPTATIDLSSLNVSSPTPPPTATTLYGGETFSQELPTLASTPLNEATAAVLQLTQSAEIESGTPSATSVSKSGAIFVTLEPTVPPLQSPTPLPTRAVTNFAAAGSNLPTLEFELDPRCIKEPTHVEYIYCVVRLAETAIEP